MVLICRCLSAGGEVTATIKDGIIDNTAFGNRICWCWG